MNLSGVDIGETSQKKTKAAVNIFNLCKPKTLSATIASSLFKEMMPSYVIERTCDFDKKKAINLLEKAGFVKYQETDVPYPTWVSDDDEITLGVEFHENGAIYINLLLRDYGGSDSK